MAASKGESGTCLAVAVEGRRAMLAEIQSLVAGQQDDGLPILFQHHQGRFFTTPGS